MSDNRVEITLSARDEGVVQALQSLQQKLDSTDAKLKKIGETSEGAASRTEGAFAKAGQQIGSFVAAVTGVGSVLVAVQQAAEALRAEEQKLRQAQESARGSQVSFADSLKAARNALGAVDPGHRLAGEGLEREILAVAKRTGATPENVASALVDSFSARGNLDPLAALGATEEAFKLNRKDLAAAKVGSGRNLDLAKFLGVQDWESLTGWQAQIQQNSRVTDPAKVGANLVPAILSGVQLGMSGERAAELTAALNQGLADEQGSVTGTAFVKLMGQIKDFVPQKRAKDKQGTFSVPADQIAAFNAAGMDDRLGVLQQSPELARAFLSKFTTEEQAKAFSRAMVTGTDQAKALIASAEQGIGDPGGAGPGQRALLKELAANRYEQLALLGDRTSNVFREHELRNDLGARTAQLRADLQKYFDKVPETLYEQLGTFGLVKETIDPETTTGRLLGKGKLRDELDKGKSPERVGFEIFLDQEKRREVSNADRLLLQGLQIEYLRSAAAKGDQFAVDELARREESQVAGARSFARRAAAQGVAVTGYDYVDQTNARGTALVNEDRVVKAVEEQTRKLGDNPANPTPPRASSALGNR